MQWANGEILGSEASSNCRVEGGGCIRHVQVLNVVVVLCPAGPGTECSGGTSCSKNYVLW